MKNYKCGVRNVNCGIFLGNAECQLRNVELTMRSAECQMRNEIKSDVISNEQRGGNVKRGEEKTYQTGIKRMQGEE